MIHFFRGLSDHRANRGAPGRDPRANRHRGPRADCGGRIRRRPGRRRGRSSGSRRRHRLPPLPLQVRSVRRGIPGGLAARGRRDERSHPRDQRSRRRAGRRRHRGLRPPGAPRQAACLGPACGAGGSGRRGRAPAVSPQLPGPDGRGHLRGDRRRRSARAGRRRDRRRTDRGDRRDDDRPPVPHNERRRPRRADRLPDQLLHSRNRRGAPDVNGREAHRSPHPHRREPAAAAGRLQRLRVRRR